MFIFRFLSSHRFSRYIEATQLIGDLVVLNLTYPISVWLRYGAIDRLHESELKTVWLMANILWIVFVLYFEGYKFYRFQRLEQIISRTLNLFFVHVCIISIVIIALDYDVISRLRMLYFYTLFSGVILFFRVTFFKLLKYIRSLGYNYRNIIIIGTNENSKRIQEILTSDISYGYKIRGFFSSQQFADSKEFYPILGRVDALESYLKDNKVDEMYVTLENQEVSLIPQLIELSERHLVRIKFIPFFQEYTRARRVTIDFYENLPILMLRKEPLEQPLNRLLKKCFDLIFSLLIVVFVFTWLFPLLIVLTKLSSPGPVFFKQRRSGENNQEFNCLKFRTMRVNDLSDELQASEKDPRITLIGAFMRKTNLDELPQFFNVLLGKMSVVGPRPHMLKHTQHYSTLIGNYLVRHYAKPGITGWAQVNGFRGETKRLEDMKRRVEYDIWYIENWSFLLDLKIIGKTIWNMFRGEKNAY
jgi:putative colanic acid biosynthesis UDP-glucose lipid carrier transferase